MSDANEGNSSPDWYDKVTFVKVRRILPTGEHEWLGWLAYDEERDDFTTYHGAEDSKPDATMLAVQWLVETPEPGEANWYLYACSYPPGGSRVLHGTGNDGKFLHWSVRGPSLPDCAFAMTSHRSPGTDELVIERIWDHKTIHTADGAGDEGLLVWAAKGDGGYPVTFEFVRVGQYWRRQTWLHNANSWLGDRKLTEIVLPGSHDAGCYHMYHTRDIVSSRTQLRDVKNQLMVGSRFLDLRASKDFDDGLWKIKHGRAPTGIPLSYVVTHIAEFLDKYPDEIVFASLLLDGEMNNHAFEDHRLEGWEIVFNALHTHHLNYADGDKLRNINDLTPNVMRALGKNFLLFTWGLSHKWSYRTPDGQEITVMPWAAHADQGGAIHVMDLQGVYVNNSEGTPSEIVDKYEEYTRKEGGWILHTNTPYGLPFTESLLDKHERNTPQLTRYLTDGRISRSKANIVNIDFVGDRVEAAGSDYDLVEAAILANLRN